VKIDEYTDGGNSGEIQRKLRNISNIVLNTMVVNPWVSIIVEFFYIVLLLSFVAQGKF